MADKTKADSIRLNLHALRKIVLDEDSRSMINKAESSIRSMLVMQSITKHDGIKLLVQLVEKKISDISFLLSNDEEISDIERKILFRERRLHEFYLSYFRGDVAEKNLEFLANNVAERLEMLKD